MKAALLLLAGLLILATPAMASMAGSTGRIVGPGVVNPGETVTFIFELVNGSTDGEATSSVHFRFPETFTVLEGWYDDFGAGWDYVATPYGEYSERVIFQDSDDNPDVGEMQGGEMGLFYVRVHVSSNTECDVYELVWKQYGDDYGVPPHWIHGDLNFVLCVTSADESTFSSVKALY